MSALPTKKSTEFITRTTPPPPSYLLPQFLLSLNLPDAAIILYTLLYNRARLSQKNQGWTDSEGRVFLYFTVAEMAKALQRGETAVKGYLRALEQAGLLERQRGKPGKPSRLCLKVLQGENATVRPADFRPYVGRASAGLTGGNAPTNNKYLKEDYRTKNYGYREGESL